MAISMVLQSVFDINAMLLNALRVLTVYYQILFYIGVQIESWQHSIVSQV
jgi:hypothetical protein